MYEVKLKQFSGPLQLLLDLIEREELPITEVSLSRVADDYLKFVNEHEVPAEELADFLVVAARLLLLKSQALLPVESLDEEEDPSRLADQLRMYRRFVEAAEEIDRLHQSGRVMFAAGQPSLPKTPKFLPPPGLSPDALRQAFAGLMRRLEPFFSLREAAMRRVVSVQEKIRDLHGVILERARLTFRDLLGGGASRSDVVVSFLALLELMRQRVVRAAQNGAFAEIELKRVE